ncbi:MAG: hypothetical protein IKV80_02065 [Bacteroidales bacterium]|nr:hypothetical protein [Bacteroidales bacterium]
MKRYLLIVMCCLFGLYQPLHSQNNEVNGHEWVDLALPSGLKWATCNVGAKTPEASGNCYAWGEIKTKDEYNEANSLTYGIEMNDISGNVQYDVAAANWGEGWRMPTLDEMQELIECCIWEWTKQNGIGGYNIIGPNGNRIFLPSSDSKSGSNFSSATCGHGSYWTSTPIYNTAARYLSFYSNNRQELEYSNSRSNGLAIRPVCDIMEKPIVLTSIESYTDLTAIIKTFVSSSSAITERGFYYGTNPEPADTDNKVVLENEVGYKTNVLLGLIPNTTYYVKAYAVNESGTSYSEVASFTTLEKIEYEYVDLGLPSGLKWATHNIGATAAEEYGNYYAWGEVLTKDEYTEKNSLTYNKPMDDISGTEYDAATVNWGDEWRMPTYGEMNELIYKCTWTWTTQNGVNGYKVASKVNSNSIFLPAAGSSGSYWSSTPRKNSSAYYLYFYSSTHGVSEDGLRYRGCTVRPVREVVEKPTVSASVENYTDLTAIIKTFVSSSSAITERGFYYGTNPEPADTDNKVVLENEVGYISNTLINLTPNTTYYVKAYATNSEGTSYSEVVSFTTLEKIEYEYVDLGLPSGLKWATHNIGATTPEEYGDYFAWGEVVTKDGYTADNSLTYGKPMDDISGTEYDAATINWGGDWRMPTYGEMNELINNCTWTRTTQKGVYGYKVTSKTNGNSIFLPAAGCRSGWAVNTAAGNEGYYWSSSPNNGNSYYLIFINSGLSVTYGNYRNSGYSIRPVIEVVEKPTVTASVENYTEKTSIIKTYVSSSAEITERGFYWGTNAEPSEADNKVVLENEVGYKVSALMNLIPNTTYYVKAYATNESGTSYSEVVSFTTLETLVEYEYVDLGLPSGLKWATHNIGATAAEEYGNYYAWGEVLTKETYTEANSETYGKSMSDISGTEYDAATVNWGDEWRMPTYNEMYELMNNCTWTWVTQNGVNGYKVASKVNSNYIFLPAAGYRNGASLNLAGSYGNYWSSTPHYDTNANVLYFNSSSHDVGNDLRYNVHSVRPVRE